MRIKERMWSEHLNFHHILYSWNNQWRQCVLLTTVHRDDISRLMRGFVF